MALIRWRDRDLEPAGTFDWLQQQINDLFDLPRVPEMQGLFDRRISPAVDVVEHPDRFMVECDLPGLEQKDIDLSIASGVLTIKGEKKGEKVNEKAKVYRKETWEGSFQRTIALPATVDAEKVEATYRDGVLAIELPKKEEARTRKIELKAR
jgi:HSP20 family protein